MKLFASLALALALSFSTFVAVPAFAAGGHPPPTCVDGTAPEGWKRPGGYCELAVRGPERVSKKNKRVKL